MSARHTAARPRRRSRSGERIAASATPGWPGGSRNLPPRSEQSSTPPHPSWSASQHHESNVSITDRPQLPALLRRGCHLEHRNLDAARGPGLAGAAADRVGHRAGPDSRVAVLALRAVRSLGRHSGRPLFEAAAAHDHPIDDGDAGAHAGRAGCDRGGAGLAGLCPRVPARPGYSVCHSGPPGPGIAGLLTAAGGPGPVFLLNALSFVATLTALSKMRSAELAPAPPQ